MSSIEQLKKEMNLLQEEFLSSASDRNIDKMEAINKQIEVLEKKLAELEAKTKINKLADVFSDTSTYIKQTDTDNDPDEALSSDDSSSSEALSGLAGTADIDGPISQAHLLMASLEASVSPDNLDMSADPSADPKVSESKKGTSKRKKAAPAIVINEQKEAPTQEIPLVPIATPVAAMSLGLSVKSNNEEAGRARLSLLKAVNQAKKRSEASNPVSSIFEMQVEEASSLKALVENTSSFLDLFFRPSKFIANQLEKQGDRKGISAITVPADNLPVKTRHFEARPVDGVTPPGTKFNAAPGNEPTNSDPARNANELKNKLSKFTFYEILSLEETATRAEIQASYTNKVKNLRARYQNEKTLQDWQMYEFAEILTKAHSVLSDPKQRKDYDLSLLGLHDFFDPAPNSDSVSADKKISGDKLTSVGLLQSCQLISVDEFAAAVQKFGEDEKALIAHFIDKHIITFEELSAAVLAVDLIENDKLSIGQFKIAMQELKYNSIRFVDTLVAEGWLSLEELPIFKAASSSKLRIQD